MAAGACSAPPHFESLGQAMSTPRQNLRDARHQHPWGRLQRRLRRRTIRQRGARLEGRACSWMLDGGAGCGCCPSAARPGAAWRGLCCPCSRRTLRSGQCGSPAPPAPSSSPRSRCRCGSASPPVRWVALICLSAMRATSHISSTFSSPPAWPTGTGRACTSSSSHVPFSTTTRAPPSPSRSSRPSTSSPASPSFPLSRGCAYPLSSSSPSYRPSPPPSPSKSPQDG
mmetsp:Transcript_7008/g.14361  ORF Transcript_7008/g.14361 Transcript_7008/m.14361 type:complete len:227 (+) Transcript_7008:654-1334(+)